MASVLIGIRCGRRRSFPSCPSFPRFSALLRAVLHASLARSPTIGACILVILWTSMAKAPTSRFGQQGARPHSPGWFS